MFGRASIDGDAQVFGGRTLRSHYSARVPVLVLNEGPGQPPLGATLVYTKIMGADSRRFLDEVDFG